MSVFIKAQCYSLSTKVVDKSKFFINVFKRNASDSTEKEHVQFLPMEEDFSTHKEINIDKLRDKSRLSIEHHNILFDKNPYSIPMRKHHLTVKYNRKMYGVYGNASGVNPGIMWPTKDDIQERKEYENVAYPFTIQEMVSAAEEEIKKREFEDQQIQQNIIIKLAKLNTWKQELHDRIAKKEAEALAAKVKRDKLIEDVRRHFGFKIDPRDDRFQEMLAKRQKEQKKIERQARMDEREKKSIAKLMEKEELKGGTA